MGLNAKIQNMARTELIKDLKKQTEGKKKAARASDQPVTKQLLLLMGSRQLFQRLRLDSMADSGQKGQ
jgi:hypothetical protein